MGLFDEKMKEYARLDKRIIHTKGEIAAMKRKCDDWIDEIVDSIQELFYEEAKREHVHNEILSIIKTDLWGHGYTKNIVKPHYRVEWEFAYRIVPEKNICSYVDIRCIDRDGYCYKKKGLECSEFEVLKYYITEIIKKLGSHNIVRKPRNKSEVKHFNIKDSFVNDMLFEHLRDSISLVEREKVMYESSAVFEFVYYIK